jgi:hypothetical protein
VLLQVAAAAASLAEAATCAAQRAVLLQAPHSLSAGVTDAALLVALPAWLRDTLREREAFQVAARGEAPGGPPPQARLLLELTKALAQRQQRRILHDDASQAQAATLHALLRLACPAYAAQCCFAAVPGQRTAAAPVVADGLVLVQWQEREQPLAMQEPSAVERRRRGQARGDPTLLLPHAPLVAAALVVVRPPSAAAAVYAVRPVPLPAVRAAHTAVKQLLVARLEPAVGDKVTNRARCVPWGKVALTTPTLWQQRAFVHRAPGPSQPPLQDLCPPPPVSSHVSDATGGQTQFAPPAAAAVAAVVHAAGRLFGDKAEAGEGVAAEAGEAEAEAFSTDFLTKLEALLNTSDGLHVTDATLSAWLARYL